MAGFVQGIDREQVTLFPARLDEYVAEDNPVRAVDAFVDGLDLDRLGFIHVQPLDIGRPPILSAPAQLRVSSGASLSTTEMGSQTAIRSAILPSRARAIRATSE
jgi:hypothetical protein